MTERHTTVFCSPSLGNAAALQKAKYNVDKHFAVVGILGKYTTEVTFSYFACIATSLDRLEVSRRIT
jgi:hypothetical protein